ncbi:MAG TPA: Asp23/Gls24 family envelope stress response protein [Gaiellaceae bacterium]|nr:Asp23/Gls24 family envelope stress response protein [Gaiellaceae bacterium]
MRTLGPGVKVTDGALTQIVVRAAEGVEGVRVRKPRRTVDVAVTDGHAHVDLELAVAYGLVLPDVAQQVQARVAEAVSRMCGLDVTAVDVSVEELDR